MMSESKLREKLNERSRLVAAAEELDPRGTGDVIGMYAWKSTHPGGLFCLDAEATGISTDELALICAEDALKNVIRDWHTMAAKRAVWEATR